MQPAKGVEHPLDAKLPGVRIEKANVSGHPVEQRTYVRHQTRCVSIGESVRGLPLMEEPPLALALFDLFPQRHFFMLAQLPALSLS